MLNQVQQDVTLTLEFTRHVTLNSFQGLFTKQMLNQVQQDDVVNAALRKSHPREVNSLADKMLNQVQQDVSL